MKTIGNLIINPVAHLTLCNGQRVKLSGREQALLEYMALHYGAWVSEHAIKAHVWCDAPNVKPDAVKVYMCKLRKRVAAANDGFHYLETADYGDAAYKMQVH